MNRQLFLALGCAIVALLSSTTNVFPDNIGWSLIEGKIRKEFPEVQRITTSELADWLNDSRKEKPLLLDVRTKPEFEVSHLAGAIRVEPGADARSISIPTNRPIVTYCSVGYRSAAFAKKLSDIGYTNVANLKGSIFRWANENRPLVKTGKSTDKVHPYNGLWGLLLDKSHRAVVP